MVYLLISETRKRSERGAHKMTATDPCRRCRADGEPKKERNTGAPQGNPQNDSPHMAPHPAGSADLLPLMGRLETMGVLAGGIAHDLNNILTPITMHAEMALMETVPGTTVHAGLQEIWQAAERAKKLARLILDFKHPGENRFLRMQMGLLIKEALKLLQPILPATVDTEHDLRTEDDVVRADPGQMLQLLLLLADNAVRAMGASGGKLTVTLDDGAAGHDSPAPRPGDSPPGEDFLSLTIRFPGQALPRGGTNGEGKSMGLTVAQDIAHRHGGAVSIHGKAGQETAYEILLPRVREEAAAFRDESAELAGGNERILLVDDEPQVVRVVAQMLGRRGYQVTPAAGSLAALDLFRSAPHLFDLVITDHNMPEMTGADLAGALLEIRPDIPIILGTGFSEEINEETAKAGGISAFVLKPFDVREFAATVRRVLDSGAA